MSELEILEGITPRSTKQEMLDRLQEASKMLEGLRSKLTKQESDRLSKIQEIEARVRAKWESRPTEPVQNVIVSATISELEDTYQFLSEFGEELLPVPMKRLLIGSRVLLGKPLADDPADEQAVKTD